ncbi:MAG: hypothetical protein ACREV9_15325, partial [Burkholderiales bacterium]
PQTEMLDSLLENLGFLGRAESWVDARRAPAPVDFNCLPRLNDEDLLNLSKVEECLVAGDKIT